MFYYYPIEIILYLMNVVTIVVTLVCLIMFLFVSSRTAARLSRVSYRFDSNEDMKDEYDWQITWISRPMALDTIALVMNLSVLFSVRSFSHLFSSYSYYSAAAAGLMGASLGLVICGMIYAVYAHHHISKNREY